MLLGTFADAEPNYRRQSARRTLAGQLFDLDGLDGPGPASTLMDAHDLQDDILLATPILYGFSLGDKRWR